MGVPRTRGSGRALLGCPPRFELHPHASSHQWALLAIAYIASG